MNNEQVADITGVKSHCDTIRGLCIEDLAAASLLLDKKHHSFSIVSSDINIQKAFKTFINHCLTKHGCTWQRIERKYPIGNLQYE